MIPRLFRHRLSRRFNKVGPALVRAHSKGEGHTVLLSQDNVTFVEHPDARCSLQPSANATGAVQVLQSHRTCLEPKSSRRT